MVHSRNKGRNYERAVFVYLDAAGVNVEALNRSGFDGADHAIHRTGRPTIMIEAKNQAKQDLAGWVKQAHQQAGPGELPVVVHKKRGVADVGGHYVTMTVETLLRLIG